MDGFRWEWTVFKSNYPLTSLSRQKIHIICRCIPCQAINCTWSGIRNFPQTRKNQPRTRTKLHFPSTSQQMDAPRQEARDVHVHSSWCTGPDTVKCPLEAPIFWFPSGYVYLPTGVATVLGFCTEIFVRKSERVNFIVFSSAGLHRETILVTGTSRRLNRCRHCLGTRLRGYWHLPFAKSASRLPLGDPQCSWRYVHPVHPSSEQRPCEYWRVQIVQKKSPLPHKTVKIKDKTADLGIW